MSVIIQFEGTTKKLNKEQIAFDKKSVLIEKHKEELNALKERMDAGRKLAIRYILPLEQKYTELLRESVLLLDQHHASRFFKKKEKEKIAFLIRDALRFFIGSGKLDDALMRIEEKYFSSEAKALAAAWLSKQWGFDWSADDLWDWARVREKMKAAHCERASDDAPGQTHHAHEKGDKDDLPAKETEARRKIVKQIYTDLVKLLHPDREPDVEKAAQKTEWMKAITIAYQENNFFGLWHFYQQFMVSKNQELLQDESQLKTYNRLFSDQLKALKRERKKLREQPLARWACDLVKGSKAEQQDRLQQRIDALGVAIDKQQHIIERAGDEEQFRLYLKHINVAFLMQQPPNDFPFSLA